MSDAIFERDGHRYLPQALAAGPWDAKSLHGGPPTAILGRELVGHAGEDGWFPVRITVELMRPVPMAPLDIEVTPVRAGRRLRVHDAVLEADGREIARARMVLVSEADTGIDEVHLAHPAPPDVPRPTSVPRWRFPLLGGWTSFGDAMDLRPVSGAPFVEMGPAKVWFHLEYPMVAGEPLTPLDRVLAAADFPNGVSNILPFDRYVYINPDLTVALHRLPETEWVLLDAATFARHRGHGQALATIGDEHEWCGTAIQSLVITSR